MFETNKVIVTNKVFILHLLFIFRGEGGDPEFVKVNINYN